MEEKSDRMCFACGPDNPIGLHLDFWFNENDELTTEFTPRPEHQSYNGMMHGGFMSLLLDEVMGKLLTLKGIRAYTARMETRYRQSARIGEKLKITGRIVFDKGRMIEMHAKAFDSDHRMVAEASARFMRAEA